MEDLVWSFVEKAEVEGEIRSFQVVISADRLEKIGYPQGIESIPEGLVIEGCAQSAGLSIHLAESGFQALPILGRVNRARFLRRILIGERLKVRPIELQRSESGAIFDCRVFEAGRKTLVAEVELLLGFLPFEEMGDGGAEAKERLEVFVKTLPGIA